jgi:hypothetical protein
VKAIYDDLVFTRNIWEYINIYGYIDNVDKSIIKKVNNYYLWVYYNYYKL